MIRRPPRSTLDRSSAASDVYKRQDERPLDGLADVGREPEPLGLGVLVDQLLEPGLVDLSLIHISEPTRPY
mgnify:CR=1 FL=1